MRQIKFFVCAIALFSAVFAFTEESSLKTRLFYIRHGEVPGNIPGPFTYIYTGCHTDESLTEKGKGQAEKCAKTISDLQTREILGEIGGIYASDLTRAIETAEPIAKELGLVVELRQNLREIYWGCAEGQLVQKMTDEWKAVESQVKQQYPERRMRWDHLPVFLNAETYNALLERSVKELEAIARQHEGKSVLIIGHGRVLKTLIADAMDSEDNIPYPKNCGIAEFTYSADEGLRFVKVFSDQE